MVQGSLAFMYDGWWKILYYTSNMIPLQTFTLNLIWSLYTPLLYIWYDPFTHLYYTSDMIPFTNLYYVSDMIPLQTFTLYLIWSLYKPLLCIWWCWSQSAGGGWTVRGKPSPTPQWAGAGSPPQHWAPYLPSSQRCCSENHFHLAEKVQVVNAQQVYHITVVNARRKSYHMIIKGLKGFNDISRDRWL